MESCYEMAAAPAWNDMATALGITPLAAATLACGYVGWYDFSWNGDWRYGGGPGSAWRGLIVDTWATLAAGAPPNGYSFDFTRRWIMDNRSQYMTPRPDDYLKRLNGPSSSPVVAPFFNWRFWGNPNVKLF